MIPNYLLAAQKAKEIYEKYGTNDPLEIIKDQPNSLILSFRDLSSTIGIDRDVLIMVCGENNQDAITTVHIVLKHDGSRLEKVRNEEALCFAYHLICMKEG